MSLTKKQVKHYKPLILSKLAEMGVKNEVGYTQLKSTRLAPQLVKTEAGYKVEHKRVPNYRAANLYKNLTKKLLQMSPEAIEKFLDTVLPKAQPAPSEEPVLINNEAENEQVAASEA